MPVADAAAVWRMVRVRRELSATPVLTRSPSTGASDGVSNRARGATTLIHTDHENPMRVSEAVLPQLERASGSHPLRDVIAVPV